MQFLTIRFFRERHNRVGKRQPAERSPLMPAVICQGRRLCHPPPPPPNMAELHSIMHGPTHVQQSWSKAEYAYFVGFSKYRNDLENLFLSSIEKRGLRSPVTLSNSSIPAHMILVHIFRRENRSVSKNI